MGLAVMTMLFERVGAALRARVTLVTLLAAAALSSGIAEGASSLAVSNLILDFLPGKVNRQNVEMVNEGDTPLYLLADLFEVIDPGLATERRVKAQDPRRAGLIVSPRKLILPPGGRRLLQILNFKPPGERERVYRIRVKPVPTELAGRSSGIKVLVGYEILVMVRPATPTGRLEMTRHGRRLDIANPGNSNVLVMNGRQCRVSGTCVDLPTKRLYAGARYSLPLPLDAPVELLEQHPGLVNRRRRVP